jgi:hypothetical protein
MIHFRSIEQAYLSRYDVASADLWLWLWVGTPAFITIPDEIRFDWTVPLDFNETSPDLLVANTTATAESLHWPIVVPNNDIVARIDETASSATPISTNRESGNPGDEETNDVQPDYRDADDDSERGAGPDREADDVTYASESIPHPNRG